MYIFFAVWKKLKGKNRKKSSLNLRQPSLIDTNAIVIGRVLQTHQNARFDYRTMPQCVSDGNTFHFLVTMGERSRFRGGAKEYERKGKGNEYVIMEAEAMEMRVNGRNVRSHFSNEIFFVFHFIYLYIFSTLCMYAHCLRRRVIVADICISYNNNRTRKKKITFLSPNLWIEHTFSTSLPNAHCLSHEHGCCQFLTPLSSCHSENCYHISIEFRHFFTFTVIQSERLQ